MDSSFTNSHPLIELDSVEHWYGEGENRVQALQPLSLKIQSGEFLGIAGPSGAGKSSLLHILGLIMSPTKGEVRFLGKNVTTAGPEELRKLRRAHIGFLFQYFHLLPTLNAVENVQLPLLMNGVAHPEAYRRAIKSLEAMDLASKKERFPREFSGGELQRIALCRATCHNPAVVLADEPTGNLDSVRGHQILELLTSIRTATRTTERAVIMVSHNEEMLRYCDRVIRLHDGRLEPTSEAPCV